MAGRIEAASGGYTVWFPSGSDCQPVAAFASQGQADQALTLLRLHHALRAGRRKEAERLAVLVQAADQGCCDEAALEELRGTSLVQLLALLKSTAEKVGRELSPAGTHQQAAAVAVPPGSRAAALDSSGSAVQRPHSPGPAAGAGAGGLAAGIKIEADGPEPGDGEQRGHGPAQPATAAALAAGASGAALLPPPLPPPLCPHHQQQQPQHTQKQQPRGQDVAQDQQASASSSQAAATSSFSGGGWEAQVAALQGGPALVPATAACKVGGPGSAAAAGRLPPPGAMAAAAGVAPRLLPPPQAEIMKAAAAAAAAAASHNSRAEAGSMSGTEAAACSSSSSLGSATFSDSDYLGVRGTRGGWQAVLLLRLDAVGRPAPAGASWHQTADTATELEAALVRDVAALWQEQWGGPEAFEAARLYNFPLMQYCRDVALWRVLSELPTWRALRAYLAQLQFGGYLPAAAQAYDAGRQPPQPWPDPDDVDGSSLVVDQHRPPQQTQALQQQQEQHQAGQQPGAGGSGSGRQDRKRRADTQEAEPPNFCHRQRRQRQEPARQPGAAAAGCGGSRVRRQPGAAAAVPLTPLPPPPCTAAAAPLPPPHSGFHGVSFHLGSWVVHLFLMPPQGGSSRVFAVFKHPQPEVAAVARELAVYWKLRIRRQEGEAGGPHPPPAALHPSFAPDQRLVQRLQAACDVEQLRRLLLQLEEEGWLQATAAALRSRQQQRQQQQHPAQQAQQQQQGEKGWLPVPDAAAAAAAAAVASNACQAGTGGQQQQQQGERQQLPHLSSAQLPDMAAATAGAAATPRAQPASAAAPAAAATAAAAAPYRGVTACLGTNKDLTYTANLHALPAKHRDQHLLGDADPAVCAVAYDLALTWRQRHASHRETSASNFPNRWHQADPLLLQALDAADTIVQLRQLLKHLHKFGWLGTVAGLLQASQEQREQQQLALLIPPVPPSLRVLLQQMQQQQMQQQQALSAAAVALALTGQEGGRKTGLSRPG